MAVFYTICDIFFGKLFVVIAGGVVGIEDTEFCFFEKFAFGGAVAFESFVIIEVVVSKISKDRNLDRDTESAKLSESVGSNFENEKFGALFFDLGDATV